MATTFLKKTLDPSTCSNDSIHLYHSVEICYLPFPSTHLQDPVACNLAPESPRQTPHNTDNTMTRRRNLRPSSSTPAVMETEAEALMPEAGPQAPPKSSKRTSIGKLPWIPLAAASGACAAINGVFAKLYAILYRVSFCEECAMLTVAAPRPNSLPRGPPESRARSDFPLPIKSSRY